MFKARLRRYREPHRAIGPFDLFLFILPEVKTHMTRPVTLLHAGFAALLLFCAATAAAFAAGGYLDKVEDMPLMDGLSETGDGGIVFDKPTGRIVRAVARGDVAPANVRAFYVETLPQLGWARIKELELIGGLLLFRREGEKLEIQIVSLSSGAIARTEVRFSITPE